MMSLTVRRLTRWRFVGGPICSSASRLSSCICSSSGAFLQQPLFGAYKFWRIEQSPGVSWINDCCDDVQALISYGETKQTSIGIPPPTCYMVVQLISWANVCRYHRRVNWKRHTESWSLTLTDETSSVFSKNTSKPPIARSQFRPAYWHWLPAVSIEGINRGETGRGQLASALVSPAAATHVTPAVCMTKHLFSRSVNASRAVCLLHSPSQITADYYHTQYRLRHATRYILFPICQCSEWILTDIRYCL